MSGGRVAVVVAVDTGGFSVIVVCPGVVVSWGPTVVWDAVVVASVEEIVELSPGFPSVVGCGLSLVAPVSGLTTVDDCDPDISVVVASLTVV